MKTIIILFLLTLLLGLVACNTECTNCEENSSTIALYINATGTAKDSITSIAGNFYNPDTGTRSIFITEQQDSVYSQNLEVFENVSHAILELDISLGVVKRVTIDLNNIDFTKSRVQIISVNVRFGILGLEVKIPEYQPDLEIDSDLEIQN